MKKSHAVFKPMSFKHRARPTFRCNRYKVDDDAIEYRWGREYNRVVDPNKSRILPILVVRDSSGSMRTPVEAVNGSPNCVGQGLSMELLASNKSEGLQPAPKGRRVRNQQSVEGNDYQSFLVIELISSKGGNIIIEPSSKYQGSQEMCEKSILNGFGMHHLVEVVGVSQKKFEEVRPKVKTKNLESLTWTGEGKEISQEYKMGCFVAGLHCLHKSTSLETSTYMEGWTEFVQIVQNYFLSYFLVNARLETSLRWELVMYKNDGDDTYDGLGLLLPKCTELGDLIVLSQRGNKRAIGLFVGNIYGILDDNESGLLMPTNALSFDEATMEKEKVEEDYALCLGDLQHEAEQVHERPIRDVHEKLALMKMSVLERPATSTVMGDSQLLQRWDCYSLCCCNSAFAPKFFFGTFSQIWSSLRTRMFSSKGEIDRWKSDLIVGNSVNEANGDDFRGFCPFQPKCHADLPNCCLNSKFHKLQWVLSFGSNASIKCRAFSISVCKKTRVCSHLINKFNSELYALITDALAHATLIQHLAAFQGHKEVIYTVKVAENKFILVSKVAQQERVELGVLASLLISVDMAHILELMMGDKRVAVCQFLVLYNVFTRGNTIDYTFSVEEPESTKEKQGFLFLLLISIATDIFQEAIEEHGINGMSFLWTEVASVTGPQENELDHNEGEYKANVDGSLLGSLRSIMHAKKERSSLLLKLMLLEIGRCQCLILLITPTPTHLCISRPNLLMIQALY